MWFLMFFLFHHDWWANLLIFLYEFLCIYSLFSLIIYILPIKQTKISIILFLVLTEVMFKNNRSLIPWRGVRLMLVRRERIHRTLNFRFETPFHAKVDMLLATASHFYGIISGKVWVRAKRGKFSPVILMVAICMWGHWSNEGETDLDIEILHTIFEFSNS